MSITGLIASFGGGIIGAYLGALPAFIMTGVFALVGGIVTATTGLDSIAVGTLAFGSLLGPHIAFAGGVAAAGYARSRGKIEDGTDILSSLHAINHPDVLIVGGIFGVIGFVIAYLINLTPIGPMTDLPGITVICSAIIVRLLFGKTGMIPKCEDGVTRTYMTGGKGFVNNVVWGGGIGIVISFIAALLSESRDTWEVVSGIYPIICFGFAACTLIFTQTGFNVPGSHHVMLPSALAAVVGINAWGMGGAMLGVLFGIVAAIIGDFVACTFNSHCDTHIDPPAATIFSLTIIISLLRNALT